MSRPTVSDAGQSGPPGRIGRYEPVLSIATGGMATVFLARQLGPAGFQREVALKLLHPHVGASRERLELLFEEARLAARIRHPNVVQVLDVGGAGAAAYLVMEYVDGDSLAGLLARAEGGRIPRPIAVRILCDALAGLHAAHELRDDRGFPVGLVHRDFSPHNLLVGADGVTKLSDFGIAKAASRITATRTGVVKGKVAYMSPEQARGLPLDRRCDVWAAGVVAWELMIGRRPYEGDEEIAVGLQIVTGRPPRLREVDPAIPADLDEAVAFALTPDADTRCPTADELRRRVAAAVTPADPAQVAEYVAEVAAPLLERRRLEAAEALRRRASPGRALAAARRRRRALVAALALLAPLAAVGVWRAAGPDDACGADLQTSREHCGACGRSCQGGACVDGQCQPMLLVTHQNAYGIALDRTHVYWTVIGEGAVYALAKSGDPKTLRALFTRRHHPRFLAVDDRAVYATVLEKGEVVRVGKDGDPASLRVLASGQPKPWEIAIDATHVYFGTSGDGAVKRVPKEGGTLEVIAQGSDPGGIAVDDDHVYWLDREGASEGSVRRWAKRDPPGRVVVMATGQARPAGIALDGSFVYWTNFNGGTVNKLPKRAPPGTAAVELARGQKAPTGISAADPDWIYFTVFGGRVVSRVARDGRGLAPLPSGTTRGPVRIAVDEASLYWTASESAGVFKLAR